MKRVIIIVLDGFGVGELPDASTYKDEGSNTLKGIYDHTTLIVPNMEKLGLYHITDIGVLPPKQEKIIGNYGKAAEQADGKNSPVGHWEMSGYIQHPAFKTYPQAFPNKMIEEFKNVTGVQGILCNEVGSGTEILKRFGEEHIKTGFPIIYTSADSVFQIAAHEEVIPVQELYTICKKARELFNKPEYNIGTVIARPFIGDHSDNFKRTYHRKDFELASFGRTMLDILKENGKEVIAIGKITDLFSGRGITRSIHTNGNEEGIEQTIQAIQNQPQEGLIYTNLVDFDMLYGHRNDIEGYARALEQFDKKIPEIIAAMKEEDILLITADHGNDPSTPSTDHSREYIPLLLYGKQLNEGVNIGIRSTYADIAETVLEYFKLPSVKTGKSFLSLIQKVGK